MIEIPLAIGIVASASKILTSTAKGALDVFKAWLEIEEKLRKRKSEKQEIPQENKKTVVESAQQISNLCEYSENIKSVSVGGRPFSQIRTFNKLGMEFVYIPSGSFMMGSPEDEPVRLNYETPHKVTLTYGFYMQTTQVTQEQWKTVMGDNPSCLKGDDRPVESVSWNDIQKFINRLNETEGGGLFRSV